VIPILVISNFSVNERRMERNIVCIIYQTKINIYIYTHDRSRPNKKVFEINYYIILRLFFVFFRLLYCSDNKNIYTFYYYYCDPDALAYYYIRIYINRFIL